MRKVPFIILIVLCAGCTTHKLIQSQKDKREIILSNEKNQRIRIMNYGPAMMRFQFALPGKDFLPYDYRDMIARHDWPEPLAVKEYKDRYEVSNERSRAVISKKSFAISFYQNDLQKPVLVSKGFVQHDSNVYSYAFNYDAAEHFAGLGHDFTGRLAALDLKGKTHRRNYAHSETRFKDWKYSGQAPLIVPFYFSSKGYGIFLNSTFTNYFNMGENGKYEFEIDDHGQGGEIDFFFIAGPSVKDVVEHYTDLTGKPRLPQLSIFGLQLTDKVHDHSHATPSNENWWKEKVAHHRDMGLAIDHLVNDNRWRAEGGKRCESIFEWDKERFPDPKEYAAWLDKNALTITLDWNRCISAKSAGWKPEYNLQGEIPFHEFAESAPDFSNPATRDWMWKLFWTKAINPELGFPVDGLWIDEVDEMYTIPYQHRMANGRWGELANYWFMFVAQALVRDGWDKTIAQNKRPYVWMRGMTAGAQRYATMWSGDTDTNLEEMELQLRGMQSAGISGFAFWGHDAGGFIDHYNRPIINSPNDTVYARWAMQMGAFAPIWKPHGMGQSRWPEDRSLFSKKVAEKYIRLRYELMPYTYSYAHVASSKGLPIVRPMLLEYPSLDEAWKFDTQYLYGDKMLVAPVFKDKIDVWLPEGKWYYYWNDSLTQGNKVWSVSPPMEELPIWIKAGAIIPTYDYALSTFWFNKEHLNIHLYPGTDGEFVLTEDDGVTEKFRKGEKMETVMKYNENAATLYLQVDGSYTGAPANRTYEIFIHQADETAVKNLRANLPFTTAYNSEKKMLTVRLSKADIHKPVQVKFK